MSTGKSPQEEVDLEAFLARQSTVSAEYGNLELVDPPAAVDEKVLLAAKAAVPPVAKSAPAAAPATSKQLPSTEAAKPAAGALDRRKTVRAPVDADVDVDVDEAAQPARRPRWLVPAALAATVLVAVGVALSMLGDAPVGLDDGSGTGALFAKRARERNQEKKAAAEAAAQASAGQDAEVLELEVEALPPPPIFEPEGPQVQDLDAAIALIRKELVLANQIAAATEDAAGRSGTAAGELADSLESVPAAPMASSVIQPRDRRLTKILELFDGGNEDLAADSLEIFLRDFEDDPISQRILAVKP